jgi:hypothetical protein
MSQHKPEENESVWMLVLAPSIWAVHFMASYLTAAIWCAKVAQPGESIATVRWAIAIYTIVAIALIFVVGRVGYLRHTSRSVAAGPHHTDTAEDRHSFMGFAMLLLSALSIVATIFVALVAVFVENC